MPANRDTKGMIERVGVAEARKRFGVLLDRVTSGETVEITRRGRPVARLIPVQPAFDSEKLAAQLN